MSLASRMLDSTPSHFDFDRDALAECIEACFAGQQACTACADACVGEDVLPELRSCITLDLNCADVCATAGRVLSRQTEYDADVTRAVVEACATACRKCAEQCEQHGDEHEHCRICAEACRRCEQACRALLDA